jgi:putative sterol carrier protein
MDASADFFSALGTRGYEPLLERMTGTLRVDLEGGRRTDRWLVAVEKGKVEVAHRNGDADCVVIAPKALFDRLVTGRANAMAALLRGEFAIAGDYNLLVLFQRVFPGPPPKRGQRRAAGYSRRQQG